MKEEKVKKVKATKKATFDFKTWLRNVLSISSKKNAKIPKINALFKLFISHYNYHLNFAPFLLVAVMPSNKLGNGLGNCVILHPPFAFPLLTI